MLTNADFSLEGRVALVTGSGRNIGRAVAEAYAAAGARVVVNGHKDRDAIEAVAAGIRERGGEAIAVLADVSDPAAVSAMVAETVERFGGLDITVANVSVRPYQPFLEISLEDWDRVIRTNLSSTFYLARAALPHMVARGRGRLIHVSGMDGFFGNVTHRAHNVTAKAGMHGLAKAIAREFGPQGITANTVAPGPIDTERDWTQYVHQEREQVRAGVPLGRYGGVDEVAGACLFLASDAGGYVSGQVIHVNGGYLMI
ncbi:3-oxoacyl-ACP reductase family protein [Pararoseomonas sp. SCSIO 73927]|uniref:SDR family NAD(P)-dependent oxidoreductase n=1 Tax=Pararoseomonas sp. SCSIO 73927 TaxID=3114537 RepID=UPI0030D0894C